jgi:hypothetical protein
MPRNEKFKPWRINGQRVGHIRSGVHYIHRHIHGLPYKKSTGCIDPVAAEAEYRRFERDPADYVPRSSAGTNWSGACTAFLAYSRDGKQNTQHWVNNQAAHLANLGAWRRGGALVFASLDTFTSSDIRAYMQARSAGEISGKPVGRASVNRELSTLKGLMRWARSEKLTGNRADLEVKLLREGSG